MGNTQLNVQSPEEHNGYGQSTKDQDGGRPMMECIVITVDESSIDQSEWTDVEKGRFQRDFNLQFLVTSSSMMSFLKEGKYGPLLYRSGGTHCNVIFRGML